MDRTLKCDHSFESYGAVLYCGAVCYPFDSQSETLGDKRFLTFDSMDRTIRWKAVGQCFAAMLFV